MATKCMTVLLLVLVTLTAASYDAQAANANPRVVPPNASYKGLTYGEWGAKWWQAAFALPVVGGYHPLLAGGAFGEEDGVLFLSGVGGGVTIPLTIPVGTPLFLPIVNTECSVLEPPPYHGDDEVSLRACANGHINNTTGLFAEIDGNPVNNLNSYRVLSPLFEYGPLPVDNVLQVFYPGNPAFDAGATSDSVDAGVYLLLTPLSVGVHRIHFGGTFTVDGFSIDTEYIITVVPKKP